MNTDVFNTVDCVFSCRHVQMLPKYLAIKTENRLCSDCQTAEDAKIEMDLDLKNRESTFLRKAPPDFQQAHYSRVVPALWANMLDVLNTVNAPCVLCGPSQLGKTFAAWAYIRDNPIHPAKALWLRVRLFDFRAYYMWRSSDVDPEEVIAPYMKAPLLVIDDLGVEENKQTTKALDLLIDYRKDYHLKTIITLNLEPAAIPDPRIRIRLDAGWITLTDAVDWRKAVAK